MKYIGFDREDEAVKWVKEQIGIEGPTGFCRAISSVDANDNFLVAVVFSNFTKQNVDTNVAISEGGRKLTPAGFKRIFNETFDYVFCRLGAARVTALVRAKNTRSRSFVEQLGYVYEGTMRKAFEDDDLIIYGFLKTDFEEHRWYHGK